MYLQRVISKKTDPQHWFDHIYVNKFTIVDGLFWKYEAEGKNLGSGRLRTGRTERTLKLASGIVHVF